MEWDIDKLADFLERKAREGVAIENKIYEWRMAEQNSKSAQGIKSTGSHVSPEAKVS